MVSDADEDDDFSGSDGDEGLDEDMEALRRACILTGTDLNSLQPPANETTASDCEDDDDDDMELVRGVQRRLSACNHAEAPLFLKPLSTLPPALSDQDDDEDDFEIFRAIQKRFSGYVQGDYLTYSSFRIGDWCLFIFVFGNNPSFKITC